MLHEEGGPAHPDVAVAGPGAHAPAQVRPVAERRRDHRRGEPVDVRPARGRTHQPDEPGHVARAEQIRAELEHRDPRGMEVVVPGGVERVHEGAQPCSREVGRRPDELRRGAAQLRLRDAVEAQLALEVRLLESRALRIRLLAEARAEEREPAYPASGCTRSRRRRGAGTRGRRGRPARSVGRRSRAGSPCRRARPGPRRRTRTRARRT